MVHLLAEGSAISDQSLGVYSCGLIPRDRHATATYCPVQRAHKARLGTVAMCLSASETVNSASSWTRAYNQQTFKVQTPVDPCRDSFDNHLRLVLLRL